MKIAQSTCVRCHGIFPRTEMTQINVSENAGTSWGLSRNLKGGSTARGSFRVYRRNKRVWVCNICGTGNRVNVGFAVYFYIFLATMLILSLADYFK